MCYTLEQFKEERTFFSYPKETFLERTKLRLRLLKDGFCMNDIFREINNRYGNGRKISQSYDFGSSLNYHYMYILAKLCNDQVSKKLILEHDERFKKIFEERRKQILGGQDCHFIECSIREKYNIDIDKPYNDLYMVKIYQVFREYYERCRIGRPVLSVEHKLLKKEEKKEKMRKVMREKYDRLTFLDQNMFSEEESVRLLEVVKDQDLVQKIKNLTKR